MAQRHRSLLGGCLILALTLLGIALWTSVGQAASERALIVSPQTPAKNRFVLLAAQSPEPISHPADDFQCRRCHDGSDAVVTFPDGSELPVNVDLMELAASAHGSDAEDPLACTSCHAPVDYQYPHAPVTAPDVRSYQLASSESCLVCHREQHETAHAGVEAENPVVCTDCHGSHDVLTVERLRAGEGTDACVSCHVENEVPQTNAETLTNIIGAGLFRPQVDNEYCLACHSQPDFTLTLDNGEELSLTIDHMKLAESVHGTDNPWQPLNCTDCHGNIRFPHEEPVGTGSLREYRVANYERCASCHEQQYEQTLDDVHGAVLQSGDLAGAVCTDCHGAHDTPTPNEPRGRISNTCAQCHEEIHAEYVDSVHGEALEQESNPDVPTCIDCHGVHNIVDPTTTVYRARSPLICARCHADEELMAKYDISTAVFSTYVEDFHGTSAVLFDPMADPNAPFNEAVCYDCHGVHDIQSPDDPESGISANLVETCQKCHPNANESFTAAWTSHYEPSLQNNTGVFLVETFYRIVIPLTVGGLGFLVMTDVYRRVRLRFGRKQE